MRAVPELVRHASPRERRSQSWQRCRSVVHGSSAHIFRNKPLTEPADHRFKNLGQRGRNTRFALPLTLHSPSLMQTMLKSEGIFSMGFIPNWASWILAAFCLCAAAFFALKVTYLESR